MIYGVTLVTSNDSRSCSQGIVNSEVGNEAILAHRCHSSMDESRTRHVLTREDVL